MVAPISALANMEMALYGGFGLNSAAPSYLNGYTGGAGAYNSMSYPYNMYSYPPYMNQGVYNGVNQLSGVGVNQGVQNQVSQADIDTLADYYAKESEVKEGFGGAITGGLLFAAMENPQSVAHPYNAIKAIKPTDEIFKGIKKGGDLHALWTGKETSSIMQDAYSQMYRVNKNACSKGFYSKWFVSPMAESERAALEKIMKEALATKDPEKIKIATEQLRAASKCNGRIPQAWNWIKGKVSGNPEPLKTPTQLAKESLANGSAAKAAVSKGTGAMSVLKSGLVKEGPMWIAMELGMDLLLTKNIQTAFSKDSKTGWTQVGQTGLRALGSAVGWTAGRAAGAWVGGLAGAKLGAIAGSAVPGLGTAVGALVGFIGGSVGMWAMGKLTKKIAGEDVGEKVKRENMKKTPEGQAQLLQFTIQKAQEGAPLPQNVQQAAERLYLQYA